METIKQVTIAKVIFDKKGMTFVSAFFIVKLRTADVQNTSNPEARAYKIFDQTENYEMVLAFILTSLINHDLSICGLLYQLLSRTTKFT